MKPTFIFDTIAYLQRQNITFIELYLNPVDYAIWGAPRKRLYHSRKLENVEQVTQMIGLE